MKSLESIHGMPSNVTLYWPSWKPRMETTAVSIRPRAVRRHGVHARRDGSGIGVVASGCNVFLNVRAADNRLRLHGHHRTLRGCNCAHG